MMEKSQRHVMEKGQEAYGTSHYLDQLNQVYSRQNRGVYLPWEKMDEEEQYELVVKFLLSLQQLNDKNEEETREVLETLYQRDEDFVEAVLQFMEKAGLISVKAGKIRLTPAGRDVVK